MRRAFFTSDHHFGHFGIIAHCNRPFTTVEEMDEEMIRRWNEVVRPGDEVFHLGDFTWGSVADAFQTFEQLNGIIYILEGNHDRQWWGKTGYYSKQGRKITPVEAQHIVKFRRTDITPQKKVHITLSHYSMRTWYRAHAGSWHLYGHSHGRLPPLGRSFDVGVDDWDFYPVSLAQVMEKMDGLRAPPQEEFEPED